MIIPDSLKGLMNSKFSSYLERPRLRIPGAIYFKKFERNLPVNSDNFVMADDKGMLNAAEEIGDKLSALFPPSSDAAGFADGSAVPSTFHAVRGVTGCGMDPAPLPLTSNKRLVEGAGLSSVIKPEDEPWLNKLIDLFFGHAVPADLRIRKGATTAAPDFQKDDEISIMYKKLNTLKILKELPRVLKLFKGRNMKTLLSEYRILFLYLMQTRAQADSVTHENGKWSTKPRLAPTEDEARFGRAATTTADKQAYRADGTVIKDHFAMRIRDVFALSGLLNYTISAVFGCFRAVYLQRFAATYKTRGAEDKKRRVSQFKFVVGSDVKTMDKLIIEDFINKLCKRLGEKYIAEELAEFIHAAFHASYVAPPNGTIYGKDFNPLFGPDPLSGKFECFPGLPSGIACNPDIGKLWMTFVYAIVYRDCGALATPDDLEGWLAGLNPDHGLQDMADDAAMLTNSPLVAERLYVAKSPYAVLETERPTLFLGDVYCKVGGKVEVYPNPVTYPVNSIASEAGVAGKDPYNVAMGMMAREHVYSKTPIFRDMKKIMSEAMRKHIGFDPVMLASKVSPPVSHLNEVDLTFVLNKDSIFYKVDPDDVSPSLLDASVATVPAADWWDDVRQMFKVPTSLYASSSGEAASLKREAKERAFV